MLVKDILRQPIENTNRLLTTLTKEMTRTCEGDNTKITEIPYMTEVWIGTKYGKTARFLRSKAQLYTVEFEVANPDGNLIVDFSPTSVLTTYPALNGVLDRTHLIHNGTDDNQQFINALETVFDHAVSKWSNENNVTDLINTVKFSILPDGPDNVLKISYTLHHITTSSFIGFKIGQFHLNESYFSGVSDNSFGVSNILPAYSMGVSEQVCDTRITYNENGTSYLDYLKIESEPNGWKTFYLSNEPPTLVDYLRNPTSCVDSITIIDNSTCSDTPIL